MVTLKLRNCGVVRLHFWRLYLGVKLYTVHLRWLSITIMLLLLTDPGVMLTCGLAHKNVIIAALCLLTLMFNKVNNNRFVILGWATDLKQKWFPLIHKKICLWASLKICDILNELSYVADRAVGSRTTPPSDSYPYKYCIHVE